MLIEEKRASVEGRERRSEMTKPQISDCSPVILLFFSQTITNHEGLFIASARHFVTMNSSHGS